MKKMYEDTGALIDTRPEEVARHPFQWFSKTSNILADVNSGKVYFVDTRFLWQKNKPEDKQDTALGKLVLKGLQGLERWSVNRAIKKYAGILQE